VRVFTTAELDAIAEHLPLMCRPLPHFAAKTGLRPEEWQALERKDIDRTNRMLSVRRTVSKVRYDDCTESGCLKHGKCKGHKAVVELAKTSKTRRQVPLSLLALAALDELPPRLYGPLFPSAEDKLVHLDNFRHRQWIPAVEAAKVPKPARIYDLRSRYASNQLAAGVQGYELPVIMGNSTDMIERHYGALLQGSAASIASRQDMFNAARAQRDAQTGR
jgi:integrase